MALDHDALQAQQTRPIVAGGVHTFGEGIQAAFGDQGPRHIDDGRLQFLSQGGLEHAAQTLATLKHHIADKAVANNHIDRALKHVVAFHIAMKADFAACVGRAQQFSRHLYERRALDVFVADVEQADGGIFAVFNGRDQGRTHHGELVEILRIALDICTQIEHVGCAVFLVRQRRAQRRAVYTGQGFDHVMGGGKPGTGVASAHRGVGAALFDKGGGYAH